jgi:NAD+ kinase
MHDPLYSTPPATPNLSTVHIPSSLSRRRSRPTSLHISRTEWSSSILLEEPSLDIQNEHDHAVTPFINSKELSPLPSNPSPSVLDNRRAMESPCFVHSHLDKGASLADWLHNRPLLTRDTDVGVSKSLQRTNDVIPEIPHSRSTTTATAPPGSIVEDDVDKEDGSTESLTKQLAETAVGVREMSKQLGQCLGLS